MWSGTGWRGLRINIPQKGRSGPKILTIPHITRRDDLELPLDVGVEKPVEVKPIWSLLPPR
jgi:hypothetical protein